MTDLQQQQHHPLEYGILSPDACDPELRQRVFERLARVDQAGVGQAEDGSAALDSAAQIDLRRYIAQLEDALLRHHWGSLPVAHIAELLKCATGLDIIARGREVLAMTAVDA